MDALVGGGGIVGLLLLWKFIEKIVDAKLGKRNNKGGNPGNPGKDVVCPYKNSVAIENSLNNIDLKLGTMNTNMILMKGSLERIEEGMK